MDVLVEILYSFTSFLLVPVVLALFALLAWTLVELGGFVRERRERRKKTACWCAYEEGLLSGARDAVSLFDSSPGTGQPGLVGVFAARGRGLVRRPLALAKLVSDLELDAQERLARMNLGLRIGPTLGLMGTLIPMGPALLGLSGGDVDVLARNLVVAFATTVVGLLVGALCFCMMLRRRRWYATDLARVEYVERSLASEGLA